MVSVMPHVKNNPPIWIVADAGWPFYQASPLRQWMTYARFTWSLLVVVHPLVCLIFTVEIHQHTHLYQYMNNPESKYLVTVDEIMVKPCKAPEFSIPHWGGFQGRIYRKPRQLHDLFPENKSNLRLCVFLHAIQQSSKPPVIPLYWLAHISSCVKTQSR